MEAATDQAAAVEIWFGYVAQRNGQRSAREDILAGAKAALADYKVPERFEIASEIPETAWAG